MGMLQRGPVPEAACPRGTEGARLRMLEGLNVGLGEGERTVFLAGRWVDSMAITDGATGGPRGQFSWLSVGHGTMGRGSWTRDRCTDLESSVGPGGLGANPPLAVCRTALHRWSSPGSFPVQPGRPHGPGILKACIARRQHPGLMLSRRAAWLTRGAAE